MEFVWTRVNVEHVGTQGILPDDAEYVVEHARPPYPQMIGEDKRPVVGRLRDGRYVQVIYVPSRSVPDAGYVIHSRPLTELE